MSDVVETTVEQAQPAEKTRSVDLEPVRKAAEDALVTSYGLALLALDGVERFVQRAYERGQASRETAGPVARMLFDLVRRPEPGTRAGREQVKVRVLPIADYDALGVDEAVKALAGLSVADLELVRAYEAEHKNRQTVLRAIEQKLAAAAQD